MQKKRKSYWSVSEIGPSPPLKVDADAADADDDGQVGIWKAPLPGGTAELKNEWWAATNVGILRSVPTSKGQQYSTQQNSEDIQCFTELYLDIHVHVLVNTI